MGEGVAEVPVAGAVKVELPKLDIGAAPEIAAPPVTTPAENLGASLEGFAPADAGAGIEKVADASIPEGYRTDAIAEGSAGPLASTPIANEARITVQNRIRSAAIDNAMKKGAATGTNGATLQEPMGTKKNEHVSSMSAEDIAREHNALSEKKGRTPEEQIRLKQLGEAWDEKHTEPGVVENNATTGGEPEEAGGEPAETTDGSPNTETQNLEGADIDKIVEAGGDGSGGPPERPTVEGSAEESDDETAGDGTETSTQRDEAAATESTDQTTAERDAEIKRLSAKKDKTPEERKQLNDLKKERASEGEVQRLREKEAGGEPLSDEEVEKLNTADAKERGEDAPEQTLEQRQEKLNKEIEDLGTEIMQKMANGEEVSQEDIDKFQKLRGEQTLIDKGFTEEQAREGVRKALGLEGYKSERGSRQVQETKDKIQELMTMEFQILSVPKTLEILREQKRVAIQEARAKHTVAENAPTQDRAKKKAEEYQAYMKVASIAGQISGTKYMAQRIDARRKDLEQQVRSKLGVTGGLQAIAEWGGAKINNVMTEIAILAKEDIPLIRD